jgi:hypothetical protein
MDWRREGSKGLSFNIVLRIFILPSSCLGYEWAVVELVRTKKTGLWCSINERLERYGKYF